MRECPECTKKGMEIFGCQNSLCPCKNEVIRWKLGQGAVMINNPPTKKQLRKNKGKKKTK